MNYYPGQGLTVGTAILGNTVGQVYPAGTVISLCKLHGEILNPQGAAVGSDGTELQNSTMGIVVVNTWKGVTVTVTAAIAPAKLIAGNIISVDKVSTTTNSSGYFELYVIKGLTVTVTCPSFGKSVTVDTTGLTTIDLSTFF